MFQKMRRSQLAANVISYNSAISACEKGQQWEQVSSLLQEIWRSWLDPKVVSYGAAISACEQGDHVNHGLQSLRNMFVAVTKSPVAFLMRALAKSSANDDQIVDIAARRVSWSCILPHAPRRTCRRSHGPSQCLEWRMRSFSNGLPKRPLPRDADRCPCSGNGRYGAVWLVGCFAADGRQARKEMWRSRLEPDVVGFNAAISAC